MSMAWALMDWTGQLPKARILLADDHAHVPAIEETFLEPEFEVVGTVTNGAALVEEALRLKPDIIITDISMPILNGIDAVDQLKESGCESRVVFLTVHSDSDFVRRCLSSGAFGYVVKSRMARDLVPAVREALVGNIFVSHILTNSRLV